jgi:hypothetical protein
MTSPTNPILTNQPPGDDSGQASLSTIPLDPETIAALTSAGSSGGLSFGVLQNFSGIGHNIPKLFLGASFLFFDYADGTYSEDWKAWQGGAVTRWMIGPWSQWRQYRTYMLGTTNNLPTQPVSANGLLSRLIPAQHPYEPSLYVTGVELAQGKGAAVLDPFTVVQDSNGKAVTTPILDVNGQPLINPVTGNSDGGLPFIYYAHNNGGQFFDGQALLKITYGHYPYLIKDDATIATDPNKEAGRWVEWQYSQALQAIQVPANISSLLTFLPTSSGVPTGIAGTPVPGNPVLLLPTASLRAIWYDVPDIPFTAIRACTGKVNPDSFPAAFNPLFGPPFAPGTLLMNPCKFENYRTPLGYWSRKVTFDWMYRDVGWNSFPAASGTGGNYGFYPATFGGTAGGTKLYPFPAGGVTFASMFQVPAPVAYQ